MKRILCILLSSVLIFLCGCAEKNTVTVPIDNKSDFFGIWVTYAELENAAKGDFKENFSKICENAKSISATALFVHIRPFCDSPFKSEYFPLCSYAKNADYDVLEVMTELCHKNGLEFHGWINPYRISSTYKTSDNPISKNSALLLSTETGIYLDPALAENRKLIIDGVREVVENYDIDGIHFDDYFYPTTDEGCDNNSYNAYKNSVSSPLPRDVWRRTNVTLLISGISSYLKSQDKKICFSVSPAADIERNYNNLYADIKNWVDADYLDAVIPQIYFGFDYPTEKFTFERLLLDWINLVDSKTNLYIGLAPYKLNTGQKPDCTEWKGGTDIVGRQIRCLKNQGEVSGAVLFSYSYIFKEATDFIKQKNEIATAIKE
ncbi:MAG: hypothetical protein E7568_02030 [Ruminococcaceae bacterium]|nr:hypothetical protein [Oscillospiraceae bacterium]